MKNLFLLLARFFENGGSLAAFLRWPKFSITSFNMLSALHKQSVLPRTVIDVGANVGQFAVAAAKLFPDAVVHSFEPNPNCADELRKNTSSLGNVSVYQVALGDEDGEVAFHVNSHSHSSSILALAKNHRDAFPDAHEVNTIQVKIDTLDNIFSNLTLARPVLLKLDVQGYEAQALRGASQLLSRVDYVVLEASFKPMYQGEMLFMEIIRLMEGFGFVFLRPIGSLADPTSGEIVQMDALFQRVESRVVSK